MSMAEDDWLESICKETPMSMTKDELRPEEGKPEEEGEIHRPATFAVLEHLDGPGDVRELQRQAWEEGFDEGRRIHGTADFTNPYGSSA